jgi:hypothetical protein
MMSLQELINQISPYDASNNPTGSKFVKFAPEPLARKANQDTRQFFRVIFTMDQGDTHQESIIEVLGAEIGTQNESWVFKVTPPFFDRKETIFLNNAEDQIKTWWLAYGKTVYTSKAAAQLFNADLNLATVRCFAVSKEPASGSILTAKIDTWMFNREGGAWSCWLFGTENLKM